MPRKHDWIAAKTDYVQGIVQDGKYIFPTVLQLSEKHGITYHYLAKRSSKEKWSDERKIFEKRAEEARNQERIRVLSSSSSEFSVTNLNVAKIGLAFVSNALAIHGKALNDNDEIHKLTVNEIESLARSATTYQRLGKIAMGEPESGTNVRLDVRSTGVSLEDTKRILEAYSPVIDEFVLGPKKGVGRKNPEAGAEPVHSEGTARASHSSEK